VSPNLADLFFSSFGETLLMVGVSGLIGTLAGVPLGVALYVAGGANARKASRLAVVASYLTYALRATPSIIILAVAITFSHFVLGASAGLAAAIIPLVIIATPFVARQTETALHQAGGNQTQATLDAGQNNKALRQLLPLAAPGIVAGIGLTLACLVGYSALAGALGGGGLGDYGIRHGYSEFRPLLLLAVVLALIVLAETAQALGYGAARLLGGEQAGKAGRLFSFIGRSR
jgi:D-methionine transport system permease protein